MVGFMGTFLGDFSKYQELIKPEFAPPSYVFSIVWTIIYILMGISAYIIYANTNNKSKSPLIIFGIQLFVNALWSYIFFGLEFRLLALIWLIILLTLVIIMSIKFYRIKPIAGILQVLYILWLLFAGVLNYTIYILNR
ncbi:TspO/MBR family protein [compost metagenome]